MSAKGMATVLRIMNIRKSHGHAYNYNWQIRVYLEEKRDWNWVNSRCRQLEADGYIKFDCEQRGWTVL